MALDMIEALEAAITIAAFESLLVGANVGRNCIIHRITHSSGLTRARRDITILIVVATSTAMQGINSE